MRQVMELFREAPSGMIVTAGPRHVIQMLNTAYANWIGHRDVVGLPVGEAFPNLDRLGFLQMLDEVYASGRARVIHGAHTLVEQSSAPPREAWTNFILQALRDREGRIIGIFCQGHDVTREKRAADKLRASRAELKAALDASQAIIETSNDLICTVDDEGTIRQINRPCETLLGYRPDEMIGRKVSQFMHPDDVERTIRFALTLAAGSTDKSVSNRWMHRDGQVVPLAWSSVWSPTNRMHYCIGRDMREHIAAEEKLRQAQKMEAVGRLTGGIAHDFNNLLTAVIGSAEALNEALAEQPELAAIAKVALDAAGRGAELVRQLLAFSRNQPLAPQPVECGAFLQALGPILRRTLGPQYEVAILTPSQPLTCLADLNQLTSAVLNLCINARDAMPGGGRLDVAAERRVDADGGSHAVISVIDAGEGMSEAVRARALEPFFTTKPAGKGTGLGLSMVFGFVTQSGGRFELDTVEGVGTEVRLFLPETSRAEVSHGAPAAAMALTSQPRVMLVEDDDLVRGEVRRQLIALGCEVAAFSDPRTALDALTGDRAVDLLMTDVVMPGEMNGRQLADHARLLRPNLPVLFSSGHTEDPILNGEGKRALGAFLPKPYRRADLARALSELLSTG